MNNNNVIKNKRVLVVDDEQSMLDIVKTILKREGANPLSANSAQKGLAMIRSQPFDAIILDRNMPDGDGHELLKQIKEIPQISKTPVIMLTGEKSHAEIKKSLALGAQGYIVKPFKPADFIKQLHKILDSNTYI